MGAGWETGLCLGISSMPNRLPSSIFLQSREQTGPVTTSGRHAKSPKAGLRYLHPFPDSKANPPPTPRSTNIELALVLSTDKFNSTSFSTFYAQSSPPVPVGQGFWSPGDIPKRPTTVSKNFVMLCFCFENNLKQENLYIWIIGLPLYNPVILSFGFNALGMFIIALMPLTLTRTALIAAG